MSIYNVSSNENEWKAIQYVSKCLNGSIYEESDNVFSTTVYSDVTRLDKIVGAMRVIHRFVAMKGVVSSNMTWKTISWLVKVLLDHHILFIYFWCQGVDFYHLEEIENKNYPVSSTCRRVYYRKTHSLSSQSEYTEHFLYCNVRSCSLHKHCSVIDRKRALPNNNT